MQTHRSQLEKDRERIEEQLAHIELTASQWALNPQFDEKLKDIDFYKQFLVTQELYKSLSIIKGSSTLIDQVYLYVDGQRLLVSEDEGIIQLTEENNHIYHTLLQDNRSILWTKAAIRKAGTSLSLVHALPRFGALIITLNESKFNDMVSELTVDKKGSSFIIKENGEWVTTGMDGVQAPSDQAVFFRQRSAQAKYGGRFVYPEVEQGRLFGFLREVFQSEFHLDLYYGYTGFPINRSRAFNVENDPGCKRGRHCDRHFSVLVRLGAPIQPDSSSGQHVPGNRFREARRRSGRVFFHQEPVAAADTRKPLLAIPYRRAVVHAKRRLLIAARSRAFVFVYRKKNCGIA